MKKYYLAVTYEVCEHSNLYLDMNEYYLDISRDIDKQVRNLAKVDVAPVVKVYESDTKEFKEVRLYKEFKFQEFECGCNSGEN